MAALVAVGIETRFKSSLSPDDLEAAIQAAFRDAVGWSGPARYQPAFDTPPDNRVVQFAEGGLIVHVAPELGTLNVEIVIDTLNPDRERISKFPVPGAKSVISSISMADPGARFVGLFASSPSFFAKLGIPAAS